MGVDSDVLRDDRNKVHDGARLQQANHYRSRNKQVRNDMPRYICHDIYATIYGTIYATIRHDICHDMSRRVTTRHDICHDIYVTIHVTIYMYASVYFAVRTKKEKVRER